MTDTNKLAMTLVSSVRGGGLTQVSLLIRDGDESWKVDVKKMKGKAKKR